MKVREAGAMLSSLDPVVYWKNPGTWVWIPGTCWQACARPSSIEFKCLETEQSRSFSWNIGAVDRFEGQFLLKKGQIKLILQSQSHYLQISLWADTSHEPCLEIKRYNGLSDLEITWQDVFERAQAKHVYAVKSAQLLLRKPSQISAQKTPVLWFGTHKRLDFDQLALDSCPWNWSYALLMAARYLPLGRDRLSTKEILESSKADLDWVKSWMKEFVKSSKGLFCFDFKTLASWRATTDNLLDFDPIEKIQAMAKAFYEHWIEVDLSKAKIKLRTQVGFSPASGRLELEEGGVELLAHWRGERLRTLHMESKLDRLLHLAIHPHPKNFRLSYKLPLAATKESQKVCPEQKTQGKLLDLELIAGAHYVLDRLEY
jgi:hypothetical protein